VPQRRRIQHTHLVVAALVVCASVVPLRYGSADDGWQPTAASSTADVQPTGRIEQLENRLDEQAELIQELRADRAADDDGAVSKEFSGVDALFDSRIDRIEQSLLGFEEVGSGFLEALSTASRRIVNGRLHIDQWSFPRTSEGVNVIENGDPSADPQDRLLYRRIRLGVRGTVPPENMSYRMEIEFSGQDGSQFRDAWIGWDDLVFFDTVRIGNQKRPYGLDHLNSSNFNVFLERPFVVDGFNEDNRRFGLVAYGVSDDDEYNWRYGLYNLELIQDIGSTVNDKMQVELAGRLAHTWWYDEGSHGRGYGHFAIAGTAAFPDGLAPNRGGRNNAAIFRTRPEGRADNQWLDTGQITGAEAYQILALESVFNVGRFQIAGEYMNLWLQREEGFGPNLFLHGGYLYVSYFLTGEHIPWNRKLGILGRIEPLEDFFHVGDCDGCTDRGIGAWQIAARLSHADFSSQDILGGIGTSATLAVNWYWNAHSRLQFNYIFGRIDDRQADLAGGGTAVVSGSYQISGARFMIDF